jgi:type IV pilus assembly protein PilC
MVNMSRAGEVGGFLDQVLLQIAANYEADVRLRSKVKSAMTYPVIVMFVAIVIVLGLVLLILPKFMQLFTDLGMKEDEFPAMTKMLMDFSHFVLRNFIPSTIAVIIFIVLFRMFVKTKFGKRLFDRFKLNVPVFGKLFTKIAISRFSRNLGTLLSVGVPVMQALDVVGGTTGNAVITEAMRDVAGSVRDGQPMSAPLARHPVFPPMVVQMMEVGEETGQISAMLDKVADFYDHEVETATESLTAAIEPVMVVVMGGIVGGMVVCLYLPMFTIYQHIQGAT